MRGIFLLSVLGLVSVAEAGLSLDLYYESLCPDSTRFISQQIGPMHAALGKDVTINFVPYGFASTMGSAEDGYQFECQHGPDECYGNLVQACTIAHAPDYDTTVNLIVCMMSASRPNEAGPDCFQDAGLDYQPILDCIESGEGAGLHAANGEEQGSQSPQVTNVPWSNFNGEHILEYWEIEETGLTAFICEVFDIDVPSCS